jgi:pSer/pThr/pTyr-binding forkhead associated (FHA) protein
MDNLFLVRYPEKPILISPKGKTTIGRIEDNTIILTEPRVSRKHAVIEWLRFQKGYCISDLGSSNGTYLNNFRLQPERSHFLNTWDKIRIASAVFTVRIVENPSDIMAEFKELRERARAEVTQIINIADIAASAGAAPGLAGDLAHLCPVELFQMLETGYKSGILTLQTKSGEGTFSVCNGRVVTASFNEKNGEQAVYETLKFNEGTFTFNPQEITVENPEITLTTTLLLMEGCRLLDEATKPDFAPAPGN